jgi:hypothetical protein
MAYGIQIETMFGLRQITTEKIPKFIASVPYYASGLPYGANSSGSFTAPGGVTSSNGFAFTGNQAVLVSMSGSTVNWQTIVNSSAGTYYIEIVRKT